MKTPQPKTNIVVEEIQTKGGLFVVPIICVGWVLDEIKEAKVFSKYEVSIMAGTKHIFYIDPKLYDIDEVIDWLNSFNEPDYGRSYCRICSAKKEGFERLKLFELSNWFGYSQGHICNLCLKSIYKPCICGTAQEDELCLTCNKREVKSNV
jgi:hypothetical protein